MAPSKNAPKNSFSLTLFDIYRKSDSDGPLPESPTFTWTDRNGASRQIPFLQPVQLKKKDKDEKDKDEKDEKNKVSHSYTYSFSEDKKLTLNYISSVYFAEISQKDSQSSNPQKKSHQ